MFIKCWIKYPKLSKYAIIVHKTELLDFDHKQNCPLSNAWCPPLKIRQNYFKFSRKDPRYSNSWELIIVNHHIFLLQHHYHHALIWNGEILILPDLSLSRLSAGCQQVDWTILHAHLDKGWGWYCKGKMPFGKVTICLSLWQLV